jgi:ubiquinone/menaquinone biosynthesis C-methylase UbiE
MSTIRKKAAGRNTERMSDTLFRMMTFIFMVIDFFSPNSIEKRVRRFGIESGMTVVDYGCGPGRYATRFAEIVGEKGKVYAVDIHELAIEAVKKRIEKQNMQNIEPVLAEGYNCGLPDNIADVVCAVDMFFGVKNPTEFLRELKRITRSDGVLVISDEHQSRNVAKKKILDSGCWDIFEETKDHLKCRPC